MRIQKLLLIETALISFLGLIALFPYIPLYASLLFALIYAWLLYSSFERGALIHGKVLNIVAILLSLAFLSRVRMGNLVRPIEYLLLSLNAVKLAGEKKPRDFIQILLINFLVVAGVASFTIEISYLIMLLTFMAVAINYAVNINLLESSSQPHAESTAGFLDQAARSIDEYVKFSTKLFAITIPVTILFFYLLPRSGSAYFLGGVPGTQRIGFSERIDISNVEKLLKSGKIAFRAKIVKGRIGGIPYWRGITYDIFRKGTWFHRKRAVIPLPLNYPVEFRGVEFKGDTVVQEITLEPGEHEYFFALDKPAGGKFPFRVFLSPDFILRGEARGRAGYRIVSVNSRILPIKYKKIWQGYTYVPESLKDTLRKLFPFLKNSRNAEIMAEKLVNFFRTRFKYSLTFEAPDSVNPVIYFLTRAKAGHCELFATSMALILRSFGVPTRLVGGYLGGDYNKLGSYYLVRENDAHTWVEVYVDGTGWVRFDPSPPFKKPSHLNLALYLDYIKLLWYEHVINYDIYSQLHLVSNFSRPIMKPRRIGGRLGSGSRVKPIVFTAIAAFLLVVLVKRRKRKTGFYENALKILRKKGFEKGLGETPMEFLRRVEDAAPEVGEALRELTEAYLAEEYGGKSISPDRRAELLNKLKRSISAL